MDSESSHEHFVFESTCAGGVSQVPILDIPRYIARYHLWIDEKVNISIIGLHFNAHIFQETILLPLTSCRPAKKGQIDNPAVVLV